MPYAPLLKFRLRSVKNPDSGAGAFSIVPYTFENR